MKLRYSTKSIYDGEMLRSYIEESPMNLTAVARHMGIANSTLLSFYKRTSLRISVLWQATQVLERNLFFRYWNVTASWYAINA
ncbi:MAG: hypothetical protein LBV41_13285 [Cytophagaceae bacterium]|jgi:hypothetical protein|nr:hypothetical protein [Cytophagaceae bacterium]